MNQYIFKVIIAFAICVVVKAQEPESTNTSLLINTENNSNAVEIKSENYPLPYPLQTDVKWSISVDQGIGMQIIIYSLDLDTNSDYLLLIAGVENDTEKQYRFTGRPDELPLRFRITNSKSAFMQFVSNHSSLHNFTGFLMSYEPFGETPTTFEPSTTTELITVKGLLQTIRREINIQNSLDEIANISINLRNCFSKAANLFVIQHQLLYEISKPENVVFTSITKCPVTWPRSATCISINFGIRLEHIHFEKDENHQKKSINIPTTPKPDEKYELSAENLDLMWTEFAIEILSENGIQIYSVPKHIPVLLTWIAISLSIILAFIAVLYNIWKTDFFKDYKRMSTIQDSENTKKDSEYDISMFPSPHQIVPSLFADVSMEERIRNSNHLFFTNDAFVYDDNNRFEISQPADVPKVIFSQEDVVDKGENLIYKADVYDKVNKNG